MQKGNASNVTVTELPDAITTTELTETIAMASPTEATEGRLPVASAEPPNLTRTKRTAVKLRQIGRGLIEKSVVFPPSATGEMTVNAIGSGIGTVTVKVLEIKIGIGTRNVIETEIVTVVNLATMNVSVVTERKNVKDFTGLVEILAAAAMSWTMVTPAVR
jgi:hypothetical protein